MTRVPPLLGWLVVLALAGCAPPPPKLPPTATAEQRDALTWAILTLEPGVALPDARRLSDLAYDVPRALARDYGQHLMAQAKRRGIAFDVKTPALCRAWAEAFDAKLRQEPFALLESHVVISTGRFYFPVEHSAVVVSARGKPLESGLVLDACRHEGRLYWARVKDDRMFRWRPQVDVLVARTWGRRPWYARGVFDGRLVRPDPLAP
ncbi:hypothetical protein M4578_20090 [Salipiger sp. P9]|uniref:hypothetical protein n=1 Tax=Salipiger pentaromativorans TaxID=2943193 RepID=UPI00215803D0|nr:hypothetical protein [Salipiger pentaromativorans]MCR8550130.1 hypothetical protein [Salipiger pentaromativorans]